MVRRPTPRGLSLHVALIATLWIAGNPAGNPLRGEDAARPFVREIFVPFEDLDVLLASHIERIFLSREEYVDLLARARTSPPAESAPCAATMLSAEYQATVEAERIQMQGTLSIDVLEEGMHVLPLELSGLGLRRATWDGQAAAIGLDQRRRPALFVEGVGQHQLVLDLVAPLETSAALQSLSFQIPVPAATVLRLTVPGNVELKSGADVMRREVDAAAGVTRFELLPRRGTNLLAMTLNNRQLLQARAVVARSVIVDEVTQGYEHLHATVSLGVLHGAADHFRFVVPTGFEVTEVSAPQLSRWLVEEGQPAITGPRRILNVVLREPTMETLVLNISAVRDAVELEAWKFPRLEPLDVAGQVAVLGLLVEDRLKAKSLAASGLIPINTSVLTDALPESLFHAKAGAPQVRPIAAYYAPQAAFDFSARFVPPASRLRVTSNLVLLLDEIELRLHGALVLQPEVDKLFATDLAVPAGWQITDVTGAGGEPLSFETYPAASGARIRIRFPEGVPPNSTASVRFKASSTPEGWLSDWNQRPATFPAFNVLDAARHEGAIAVRALDDLVVRPEQLEQLVPLDEADKTKYGLAGIATDLVYLVEAQPYAATFVVERTSPVVSARTMSFLSLEPENLVGHYEAVYEIQQARTNRLWLQLPAHTPAALSIRGLDGIAVQEFHSQVIVGQRRWDVRLAEKQAGRVRLAVDFQQRLDVAEPRGLELPLLRAVDVAYQSGFVSVEGSAELDIQVRTDSNGAGHPLKIDVGELAEADYAVGRRVLAAYGFVGDNPTVKVDVFRRSGFALPSAIVQRAELITLAGVSGASATAARYQLRTKSPYLEVILPAGADLWSAALDGSSLAPQRDQDRLLLALTAKGDAALRDLQIVYGQRLPTFGFVGQVQSAAPRLLLRDDEATTSREVPVADMRWYLRLPTGYRAIRCTGTVEPDLSDRGTLAQLGVRRSGWARLAGLLPRNAVQSAGSVTEMRPRLSGSVTITDRYGDARSEESLAGEPDSTTEDVDRPADGSPRDTTYWALEGVRSLPFSFSRYLQDPTAGLIAFESLGFEPMLNTTLINRQPLAALAWSLALVIALLGLRLLRHRWLAKTKFLFVVLVAATVLPLLLPWDHAVGAICDMALWTACALVPLYLLFAIARWWELDFRRHGATPASKMAAASVAIMLILWSARPMACHAQSSELDDVQLVIPLGEHLKPVQVPADAIVIPYYGDDADGVQEADRILLPYQTYAELWKMAYPDKQPLPRPAPAPFALAGASFDGRLAGDDFLALSGRLQFDVYTDDAIDIPLALAGGVLVNARLDGQPARLRVAQVEPPKPTTNDVQPAADTSGGGLLMVNVAGKGRKTLDLAVRLRLERRGGWRMATGRLPAAPATVLTLHVPDPQTEVHLTGVSDRSRFESTAADERIETALQPDHAFSIQWRPKVAEGEVDKSLTADSNGELEIRDDAVRLAWQVSLDFPRSRRESLTLTAPSEYLVERVTGGNVRGWQATRDGARQTIDVTLLKAAADKECLTIHLSRRGRVGQGNLTTFPLPAVTVVDASLHQGTLVIRRSPLLEVRMSGLNGLARTDWPQPSTTSETDPSEQGILVSRPFQAYRFQTIGYAGTLSVAQLPVTATARVQSILRIADRESRLETLVVFRPTDRPLHGVRVVLPANLQVEQVTAPDSYDWSVTEVDGQRTLSVYLGVGQTGEFSVLMEGTLGRRQSLDPVSLPVWRVLDVTRQEGEIAVQVDPAIDVRAEALHQCNSVSLSQAFGWLRPEQQATTRLALHYRVPDYSATLTLAARQPHVTCDTISNIRVTGRAIEETVWLDFNIRDAGIRQIVFQLPAWMKDARIKAPLLRQKTIEDLEESASANSSADKIRVRLELQDEVMGPFRVLVENDRLLTNETHFAPIPVVETGRTGQQFVSLERSGRGEVVFDEQVAVESLTHQQQPWRKLTELFGDNMLAAYLVQEPRVGQSPRLSYHTQDHAAVETAGARIGYAETVLTLDASGTYRAQQVYRIDNSIEQFLVIELPRDAQLWTARVAGEPVKPTAVPGQAAFNQVRIPLVKTAPGDADYEVSLIYAGKLPTLAAMSALNFPLVKTLNIHVELSLVRLHVPANFRWFNFGGTMRLVNHEAVYHSGYAEYLTRQMQQLSRLLQSDPDELTRLRCANNLKQLDVAFQEFQSANSRFRSHAYFSTSSAAQSAALEQAERLLASQTKNDQGQSVALGDNRIRLGQLVEQQHNQRARNVVNRMDGNFRAVLSENAPQPLSDEETVNSQWFAANQLMRPPTGHRKQQARDGRIVLGTRQSGIQRGNEADMPRDQVQSDFDIANVQLKKQFEGSDEKQQAAAATNLGRSKDEVASVGRRYAMQLEKQSAQAGIGLGSTRQGGDAFSSLQDATMGGMGGGLAATASTPPVYLASLDMEIPRRGTVYLFKTPRGEVEITAQAIDNALVGRLWRLALTAAVVAGLLIATRWPGTRSLPW